MPYTNTKQQNKFSYFSVAGKSCWHKRDTAGNDDCLYPALLSIKRNSDDLTNNKANTGFHYRGSSRSTIFAHETALNTSESFKMLFKNDCSHTFIPSRMVLIRPHLLSSQNNPCTARDVNEQNTPLTPYFFASASLFPNSTQPLSLSSPRWSKSGSRLCQHANKKPLCFGRRQSQRMRSYKSITECPEPTGNSHSCVWPHLLEPPYSEASKNPSSKAIPVSKNEEPHEVSSLLCGPVNISNAALDTAISQGRNAFDVRRLEADVIENNFKKVESSHTYVVIDTCTHCAKKMVGMNEPINYALANLYGTLKAPIIESHKPVEDAECFIFNKPKPSAKKHLSPKCLCELIPDIISSYDIQTVSEEPDVTPPFNDSVCSSCGIWDPFVAEQNSNNFLHLTSPLLYKSVAQIPLCSSFSMIFNAIDTNVSSSSSFSSVPLDNIISSKLITPKASSLFEILTDTILPSENDNSLFHRELCFQKDRCFLTIPGRIESVQLDASEHLENVLFGLYISSTSVSSGFRFMPQLSVEDTKNNIVNQQSFRARAIENCFGEFVSLTCQNNFCDADVTFKENVNIYNINNYKWWTFPFNLVFKNKPRSLGCSQFLQNEWDTILTTKGFLFWVNWQTGRVRDVPTTFMDTFICQPSLNSNDNIVQYNYHTQQESINRFLEVPMGCRLAAALAELCIASSKPCIQKSINLLRFFSAGHWFQIASSSYIAIYDDDNVKKKHEKDLAHGVVVQGTPSWGYTFCPSNGDFIYYSFHTLNVYMLFKNKLYHTKLPLHQLLQLAIDCCQTQRITLLTDRLLPEFVQGKNITCQNLSSKNCCNDETRYTKEAVELEKARPPFSSASDTNSKGQQQLLVNSKHLFKIGESQQRKDEHCKCVDLLKNCVPEIIALLSCLTDYGLTTIKFANFACELLTHLEFYNIHTKGTTPNGHSFSGPSSTLQYFVLLISWLRRVNILWRESLDLPIFFDEARAHHNKGAHACLKPPLSLHTDSHGAIYDEAKTEMSINKKRYYFQHDDPMYIKQDIKKYLQCISSNTCNNVVKIPPPIVKSYPATNTTYEGASIVAKCSAYNEGVIYEQNFLTPLNVRENINRNTSVEFTRLLIELHISKLLAVMFAEHFAASPLNGEKSHLLDKGNGDNVLAILRDSDALAKQEKTHRDRQQYKKRASDKKRHPHQNSGSKSVSLIEANNKPYNTIHAAKTKHNNEHSFITHEKLTTDCKKAFDNNINHNLNYNCNNFVRWPNRFSSGSTELQFKTRTDFYLPPRLHQENHCFDSCKASDANTRMPNDYALASCCFSSPTSFATSSVSLLSNDQYATPKESVPGNRFSPYGWPKFLKNHAGSPSSNNSMHKVNRIPLMFNITKQNNCVFSQKKMRNAVTAPFILKKFILPPRPESETAKFGLAGSREVKYLQKNFTIAPTP